MDGWGYVAAALFLAAIGWAYGRRPARQAARGGRYVPAMLYLAAALALGTGLIYLTTG